MIRKILFLFVLLSFGCNFTASAFSGGNGSLLNPYKIASASDFQEIQDNTTSYYILTEDIIDVTPLSITFKGFLDGQGYSISLNYEFTNTSRGKYQLGGLFKSCIGADIKNVVIKGTINIKANYRSGDYKDYYWYRNKYSGLGDDVEIYLKEAEIGGICANAKSSVFSNCKVECNITWYPTSEKSSSNSRYTYELLSNNCSLGGIIGYATDCDVISSSVTGKIKSRFINATSGYWSWAYSNFGYVTSEAGNNKSGGFMGYSDNCRITNSHFSGIIESEGGSFLGVGASSMLGGLVGYSNNSMIRYSYYGGTFIDNEILRSFGYICGGGYLNAEQCISICDKPNELMFAASGSFTKCYTTKKSDESYTDEISVDEALLALQSWYEENLPGWDFVNTWYIPSIENGYPLLSVEPKVSLDGDFYYGGTAFLKSQNTQKGLIIESKETANVDIDNNSILFKKAGEIILIIKQDAYGEFKKVFKEISVNVAKANLNISLEPSESIYGEEIPEFVLKYDGFILNDNERSLNSLPKLLCDASPVRNIGEYPIIMQGGDSENYNIICSNGIHTILPRTLKVTPIDCSRKYGYINPTFRLRYDGFINGDNENIVASQPSIMTSADKYSDTGVYSILCNGGSVSKNYKFEYGIGQLTIEKANLNIAVIDTKKEEGTANPKFELEFDGFRNSDNISDLDELPLVSCDANISSKPGVYPIILSGGYDNNYQYILRNGQLIVEEKRQTDILVHTILLSHDTWEGTPGDKLQLSANIIPENATNKTLNWISSDENVASVNDLGIITAHNIGTCVITVTATDGSNINSQCKVTISASANILDEYADCYYDLYNIQGLLIKRNVDKSFIQKQPKGIYIIRNFRNSRKIII